MATEFNTYNRYICLDHVNGNLKEYISENDIYLTNKKIDLSDIAPDVKETANAIMFEISPNVELIVTFLYIKSFGLYPTDNINDGPSREFVHNFKILLIEDSGKQKINEWLPYLKVKVGNYKYTPLTEIFDNIHGNIIDYAENFKLDK